MARHEADREDLWAEAVGLTSRIELIDETASQRLLVGFRQNGWFSIYFGQDVMLQFTPEGGLRRAYRHGDLFRTQGTTLARLRRHRTAAETTLLRYDLSTEELHEFRRSTLETLTDFLTALTAGQLTAVREVNRRPVPLLEDIRSAVQNILAADRFVAPAIAGKR